MKKKIYVFSTQKKHQTTKTKGLMIIQNQNSIKKNKNYCLYYSNLSFI